ncbi:hypothetical protein FA13DRAFT_1713983 [Coprinellus micaceus]|uniref:Uncharacterized protein n=1 Tax=Coprinellus micaceus TaxID=71717 RepID=A0A4Y7SU00_COPMI|nr:hypothetical protein FA13DRAFT_1713983 [Coprinellus micaceus]
MGCRLKFLNDATANVHDTSFTPPLNHLKKSIIKGDRDAFQLATCIRLCTDEQPLASMVLEGVSPRITDYEQLAHTVAAYHILDVFMTNPNQPPSSLSQRPCDTDAERAKVVPGFHPIPNWLALVLNLPDMVQSISVDKEVGTATRRDLISLAKSTIWSSNSASVSGINANLHTATMYLLCLCNERRIQDSFMMESAKSLIHDNLVKSWSMTMHIKKRFVDMTSTSSALKGMQNCFKALFLETPLLTFERSINLVLPSRTCNKREMLQLADAVKGLFVKDTISIAPRWFCSDEVLSPMSSVEPIHTDPDSDGNSWPSKCPRLLSDLPSQILSTPTVPPSVTHTMTMASFTLRPPPLLEVMGWIPTLQPTIPAPHPTQAPVSMFRIVGPSAPVSDDTLSYSMVGSTEQDAPASMEVYSGLTPTTPPLSWDKLTTPASHFTSSTPSRQPTPPLTLQFTNDPKTKSVNTGGVLPGGKKTKVGGKKPLGGKYKKPTGNPISYLPCMYKNDLALFYEFHWAIEEDYHKGLPIHVSKPGESAFKFYTKDDFSKVPGEKLREEFTKQDFIVQDKDFKPGTHGFSLEELDLLVPIDKEIELHDLSKSKGPHVLGTMVFNKHLQGNNGKILNVLNIPLLGNVQSAPLFSDYHAFRVTRKDPLAPSSAAGWGIASWAGTFPEKLRGAQLSWGAELFAQLGSARGVKAQLRYRLPSSYQDIELSWTLQLSSAGCQLSWGVTVTL